MPRTTPEQVRAVIDLNPQMPLEQVITTANNLTNVVATADTSNILNDGLLTDIETYLAAHFAALKDQQYESKSTDGASGKFQSGQKGKGLYATDWGANAVALDITGKLASIAEGVKQAGMIWLGKAVNEQVDYWDRN